MRQALLLMLLIPPTFSSASGHWAGRWQASTFAEGGDPLSAKVELRSGRGTWITQPSPAVSDAGLCMGVERTILLQQGPSSTLRLTLLAHHAAHRCESRSARLTVVDEATLEGEFETGEVLRLERQPVGH